MSFFHFIEKSFHWEEGSIKEFENLGSSLLLYVEFTSTASRCPYCHHKILHIKDYRDQKVLLGCQGRVQFDPFGRLKVTQ